MNLSPSMKKILNKVLDECEITPLSTSQVDDLIPLIKIIICALADEVVPAEDEDVYIVPWNLTEHMRQRQSTRRKLLSIAAELEVK
jgi:hypothetical protein